jgi:mRNA-degrading endonuclease RelE of RelBE toxin-antitoxin system
MEKKYSVNTELVEEWLTQTRKKSQMVDAETRATFLLVLELFEDVGPIDAREKLPRSRTKHLFDGIWEIRVDQYRIAYFWDSSICVLLYGIRKKRDEWTSQEKEIVKKRKVSYLEAKTVGFTNR